jgi:hypothetical protein
LDSEDVLLFVLVRLLVTLTVRVNDDEKERAGDADLEIDLE